MKIKNNNAYSIDDAYKSLDNINSWIINSDTKASIVLGLLGVLFTIIFSNSDFINILNKLINEIFNDIAESIKGNLAILFRNACKHIEEKGATEGFNIAIETTELNVTKEDKQVMKSLSKLLGKTDVEGQINEIELTETFLDTQIEKAEIERQKNAKLYQTLGVICGLGLVIILL